MINILRKIVKFLDDHIFGYGSVFKDDVVFAQQLFQKYYSQCFWYCRSDLKITRENINLVIKGLRTYGGREGFIIAKQLEKN